MKLLREPLFHFLLIGAALFAIYAVLGKGAGGGPSGSDSRQYIDVTATQVAALRRSFELDHGRPPSDAEIEKAIDGYVREEILVREARAQGLDLEDSAVRRRLVQRMEFTAEPPPPTDAQLAGFLAAHGDMFRVGQKVSFQQVFINREKRGAPAAQDARELLATLTAGGSAAGDPSAVPATFQQMPRADIAKLFGEGFAKQVIAAETNKWIGPLDSTLGLHLVHINERTPGNVPALADVHAAVASAWTAAHRAEAIDALVQHYRQQYTISLPPTATTRN